MSYYTQQQLAAIAISCKCTAAISFVSSCYIIQDILRSKQHNSQSTTRMYTTMQRILLGISLFDLEADAWFFVGTWALPRDTPGVYDPRGNDATCTAQGFFLQSGLSIPIYQVSLATFYYLSVCHNWREESEFKDYQYLFHVPPILYSLSTALYGAIDNHFHPTLLWCFFTDKKLFFYVPLWGSYVASAVLLGMIYRHVRQQEKRVFRMTFRGRTSAPNPANERANRKYSWGVLKQSLYYSCSFYFTFIFVTILRVYQTVHPRVVPPFSLVYLTGFFLPFQGFFNLVVYKRLSIEKCLRHHRHIIFCRKGDIQGDTSKKQTSTVSAKLQVADCIEDDIVSTPPAINSKPDCLEEEICENA